MKPFDASRAEGAAASSAAKPQFSAPEGTREDSILKEFYRLAADPDNNLPNYENDPSGRRFNNSNTFASHLVEAGGGRVEDVPRTAYGAKSKFDQPIPPRTLQCDPR